MTRAETVKIMAVLRAAYPRYYAEQKDELEAVIALWHEMLEDIPYPACAAAVKRLIATDERGFPPVIGQIRAQLSALSTPDGRTGQQAWAMVARAVRDSSYHAAERFAELPEDVQKAVGSPRQLRDWAQLSEEELQTVVSSNFQRSYREMRQRQSEMSRLPSALRPAAQKLIQG